MALAQKPKLLAIDVDGSVLTKMCTLPTYAVKLTSLTKVAEACGRKNVIGWKEEDTLRVVKDALAGGKMTIILSKRESDNFKVPVNTIDQFVTRDRLMKSVATQNA